jgi:hypothetical protein
MAILTLLLTVSVQAETINIGELQNALNKEAKITGSMEIQAEEFLGIYEDIENPLNCEEVEMNLCLETESKRFYCASECDSENR